MSARLLRRTLGHTDERAKAESELLGAMDVVKCATWEVRAPSLSGAMHGQFASHSCAVDASRRL